MLTRASTLPVENCEGHPGDPLRRDGRGQAAAFRGFRAMAGVRGRVGAAIAAVALVAGTAAQAAPSCWRAGEVQAARVRQMQTMLMVATLRCRAARLDIVADYDAFVTRQNAAIAAANRRIKQHFAAAGGAQADYDRFATSLANGFGDDETSEASCAEAAALARDGSAAVDDAALDGLAAARLFPAALEGGACDGPATPQLAKAVTGPAPVVMLAAAPRAPVTLPADVVAALTVMARFRDTPDAPATAGTGAMQVAAIAK